MILKGVVFDLDHTLYDRYSTIMEIKDLVYDNLKEYIAESVTSEVFARNLCDSDKSYIIFGWEKILEDLVRKNMFAKIPDFKTYAEAVRDGFVKKAVPYPFTYTVLEFLKSRGLKIGIITNGKVIIQNPKLEMLGLKKYTDAIVISGALGIQKPSPEPFLEAATLLSEKPENLLYVGDHPLCDVEGSRNAGFTPVWVKTHGVWHDDICRAEHEIDSIAEIPALVDSLLG